MSTTVVETQQCSPELQEAIVAKQKAWSSFAEKLTLGEMQLQAQAQAAISRLIYPKTIEEAIKAEAVLKEVKAEQKATEAYRKQFTSKFDDVSARLMIPEKSFADPIARSTQAIIAVKEEHAKKERLKQQKAEEIASIKERVLNHLNNLDLEYRSNISASVASLYENALTVADVKPANVADYVVSLYGKFTTDNFKAEVPAITLKLVQQEEMSLILDEVFTWDPNEYIRIYTSELDKKFEDYATAYANKQQAIELSQKQQAEKQEQLENEAADKAVATSLEMKSQPLAFTANHAGRIVKDVKRSYGVSMEDTHENAMLIIRAYFANKKACDEKLGRRSKWFSFSPENMIVALAKLKSEDNNFQPAGIIFKEVTKL